MHMYSRYFVITIVLRIYQWYFSEVITYVDPQVQLELEGLQFV